MWKHGCTPAVYHENIFPWNPVESTIPGGDKRTHTEGTTTRLWQIMHVFWVNSAHFNVKMSGYATFFAFYAIMRPQALVRWFWRKPRVTGSESVSVQTDDLKIVFLSIFTPCWKLWLAVVQRCWLLQNSSGHGRRNYEGLWRTRRSLVNVRNSCVGQLRTCRLPSQKLVLVQLPKDYRCAALRAFSFCCPPRRGRR